MQTGSITERIKADIFRDLSFWLCQGVKLNTLLQVLEQVKAELLGESEVESEHKANGQQP